MPPKDRRGRVWRPTLMRRGSSLLLAGWLVGIIASAGFAQTAPRPPEFPAKGMVTLVDLGATECIPCKMMAPILRDLAREYEGKAAVIFIDVWKNPAPARQTGVRMIPTQIFYDKQGKEVGRHEGFLDKKSIVAAFEKLGVKR
jgi:thioredoxin 1